jgi:hypothetical protein
LLIRARTHPGTSSSGRSDEIKRRPRCWKEPAFVHHCCGDDRLLMPKSRSTRLIHFAPASALDLGYRARMQHFKPSDCRGSAPRRAGRFRLPNGPRARGLAPTPRASRASPRHVGGCIRIRPAQMNRRDQAETAGSGSSQRVAVPAAAIARESGENEPVAWK